MKNLQSAWAKLRKRGFGPYKVLVFCNFLSVMLITSFSVIMESDTVQTMLPPGGDSRTQMMMCFILAIVGCVMFTAYASSLFFRGKSREIGVLMALGISRKRLRGLLMRDVCTISVLSALVGMVAGVPLAILVWQSFRLFFPGEQMRFAFNAKAFLWPGAFAIFALVLLCVMALRFVKRSNIMEIVMEQRKSEQVKDVKGWYGPLGIVLALVGVFGGALLPGIIVKTFDIAAPLWTNLFYLLVLAGIYMIMVFFVVRGFNHSRASYYKNIITRSMMRFGGRQTVRNMVVITILVAGAFFGLFYLPTNISSMLTQVSAREYDAVLNWRSDETGMYRQDELEAMAAAENVTIQDYATFGVATLATDGWDMDYDDDGNVKRDYFARYQEVTAISESDFNAVTGLGVNIAPGTFGYIRTAEAFDSYWDFFRDISLFHNMATGESREIRYGQDVHYEGFAYYYLLDDTDYAAITESLTDDWRETIVLFNTQGESSAEYAFESALYYDFIGRASENMAVYEIYDRVNKAEVFEAQGLPYFADNSPDHEVHYDQPDSFEFMSYWKYKPSLAAKDYRDSIGGMAVFLMLFLFIAIVCFAAVLIIAYTRSANIADANARVYDDLRHLGAADKYLYRQVRGQVAKVYSIPVIVGSLGIFAYFALILGTNSGVLDFSPSETIALAVCLGLVLVCGGIIYLFYRSTLKKVCTTLHIHGK